MANADLPPREPMPFRVSRRLTNVIWSAALALAFVFGVASQRYIPRMFATDVAASPRFMEKVTQFDIVETAAPNVFLGDSLTERGLWNELLPDAQIANRGLGSVTVAMIIDQLDRIPASAKAAFVLAGVNDVSRGRSADQIAADYTHLIDKLKARGLAVHVVSTLLTSNAEWNRQIDRLNRELSAICDNGICTFIDINEAIGENGAIKPDLTSDGTHITGAGYRIWSDAVKPYLQH